jgi:glycosyltransferase involved in cell wall biosynthesis
MQNKKILFVQESLTLAGGEKSLIALLSNLDPNKYDIDLQLFKFGGALDKLIPDYVNILPPIPYTQFAAQSWKDNFLSVFKKKNFSYLLSKIKYSLSIRRGAFNTSETAERYWKNIGHNIENNPDKYDVAIAYAHNIPTFYVIEKTKAKKKIAWVNVKLNFPKKNKIFQEKYYKTFDHIITVSDITFGQFNLLYPHLKDRVSTIYDIIDYKSMLKMSKLYKAPFDKNIFNILTVARLNRNQKGYDITLEACKTLKEKGISFHWYALGAGPYKEEMEVYIEENNLQNHFSFLGTTVNPYPYFKAADLYVQTSRHEGYGISIAEARLLNIPVVTTRYDSVEVQMIHEKNGLITDLNPESVAEGIIRIMNDKELYHSINEYLKSEQ